jgi:two-component system NtrC family sensor kinase
MKHIRSSIRLKLTVATLTPLAVAIVLFYFIGASLITSRILAQAQHKVQSDLNSAHEILLSEQARIGDIVRLISISPDLAVEVDEMGSSLGVRLLSAILRNEKLGFLTVVDRYGTVHYRAANPSKAGDSLTRNSLVASALKGKTVSGVMLITPESAMLENPDFPMIMQTRVRSTPHARPYSKSLETRGLMLVSASPLRSSSGAIVGAVCGGVLLNSQNDLVDKITRVVFDKAEGGGNATIFLDDVRIATTVVDEKKERAIGTRMSEEVYNAIMKKEKWVGRAFVFNDWYYSAYEPLLDIQGEIVGAMYVGTPEYPFIKIRDRIRLVFGGVIFLVTMLGVTISATLGKRMASPIKALEEGARRIANGEELPDITVDTHDEIAALAEEFNIMKKRLLAREGEVLSLNRTLEEKVLERTAQLEEQGRQLLATQAELAHAERLAGLGMLAAGVAHEINNPLAIIRGNAELIQISTERDTDPDDEVATIMHQVARIERIVRNLLTFSRGGEKQLSVITLGRLLDEILDQVHHQIPLDRFHLKREYRGADIVLEADEDQLRQVFTNLVLNSLQAMENAGTLTLNASLDSNPDFCRVTVSDSGVGIGAQQMGKLFTPFFTTKRSGTGLGLAISYGIVKNHGGVILVRSEANRGTDFIVVLPLRQEKQLQTDKEK